MLPPWPPIFVPVLVSSAIEVGTSFCRQPGHQAGECQKARRHRHHALSLCTESHTGPQQQESLVGESFWKSETCSGQVRPQENLTTTVRQDKDITTTSPTNESVRINWLITTSQWWVTQKATWGKEQICLWERFGWCVVSGAVDHALDNEKQNTEQLFTWWTPSFLHRSSQWLGDITAIWLEGNSERG